MLKTRKKLGEMLQEAGLIESVQLETALRNYKSSGRKLGQYMVREGMVNENAVVDLISNQVNIKRYNPNDYTIKPSLAKILDVDTARKFQAIPIDKKGNVVRVAMADPLDINALDHIEILTDSEVEAVICTEQEINLLNIQ